MRSPHRLKETNFTTELSLTTLVSVLSCVVRVSLLCDRLRPSSVHPYRAAVTVVLCEVRFGSEGQRGVDGELMSSRRVRRCDGNRSVGFFGVMTGSFVGALTV